MVILYSFFIQLYGLALSLAALVHNKAAALRKGRQNIPQQLQRLQQQIGLETKPVWIHAASVGEFEQALPVYEKIIQTHPNLSVVFSFYSPSGFSYAEKKYPDLPKFFLPLDTKSAMQSVIKTLNPSMVLIIKYEFWYHLLTQLKKQQIPAFLISGIFRKNQAFFQPLFGSFFKTMLLSFEHLFVQNEESVNLVKPLVGNRVSLSGDTRCERVLANRMAPLEDSILNAFCNGHRIFLAGSVWNEDNAVLQAIIHSLPSDVRIVIAPHEIAHYDASCFQSDLTRYSQADLTKRILLIDTLGLLSRAYRFAQFAYVGGGFGKGIHNILEAQVYGIPVLFGPKYQKFHEAQEMIALGTARSINLPEEAALQGASWLSNDKLMTEIRQKLAEYFQSRTNISGEITVFLSKYLPA